MHFSTQSTAASRHCSLYATQTLRAEKIEFTSGLGTLLGDLSHNRLEEYKGGVSEGQSYREILCSLDGIKSLWSLVHRRL